MANFHNTVALSKGRHCTAGRGWAWISEGWDLFRATPGAWIGLIVLWMLIQLLANIVPMAGLVLAVLGPVINAGIFFAARDQEAELPVTVAHLWSGFKSSRFGQLALLGFLTLVLILIVIVAIAAVFFVLLGGIDFEAEQLAAGQALVGVTLALVLMLPAIMALWFATNLVALHDVAPMQAFGMSFSACLSNIGSLTVFSLIMIPLCIVAAIPFGLGFLVLGPVGFLAMYRAYVDIFRQAEQGEHDVFNLG